jgi:hypothetical protein
MKTELTTAIAALTTIVCQAQTPREALLKCGVSIKTERTDHNQWAQVGDDDGSVAYSGEGNALGYKMTLDEWAKLKVCLDETYGEPERVKKDVEACAYCGAATEYNNWNTAIQAGSGWIHIQDEYNNGLAIVLKTTKDLYMVMLLRVR